MYIPKYFRKRDPEDVRDFIRQNSFGILVNTVDGKPWATHIPLILDKDEKGKDILTGHISRANPQWKAFQDRDVLVIFTGPHAYISSSWYDHENVPTWNYEAVHVYGKVRIVEGEKLHAMLKKMIDTYERGEKHPLSLDQLSTGFVEQEIKGIVGFEIAIEEIHAAEKLSQNRDDENKKRIIEALRRKGDQGSMAIMERMIKKSKDK